MAKGATRWTLFATWWTQLAEAFHSTPRSEVGTI